MAMTSLQKGTSFEVKVHDKIAQMLKNEEFFVSGKLSKIRFRPTYYSYKRQKDIIFDLSIETFLPNATAPSLITVIECKNLNTGVPVDDVEELDSKLHQLDTHDHRIKGLILTSHYFQSGCLPLAKNTGIGLAQLSAEDVVDWVVYRKSDRKAQLPGEAPRIDLKNRNACTAYLDSRTFRSLPALLIHLSIIDKYENAIADIRIPYRSEQDIQDLIDTFPLDTIYSNGRLDDQKFLAFIREEYGAKVLFGQHLGSHEELPILGHLSLKPPVISLSAVLRDDRCRERFTLAHEVGHLALHLNDLIDFVDETSDFDKSLGRVDNFSDDVNRHMETQANKFASHLLLRGEDFLADVETYFREENLHKPYIYFDHQQVNQQLVYNLLLRLKNKYLVSMEASKIRLTQLGLIRYPS